MLGKIKTSLKSVNRVQRKKKSLAELNNGNNKITKQYC